MRHSAVPAKMANNSALRKHQAKQGGVAAGDVNCGKMMGIMMARVAILLLCIIQIDLACSFAPPSRSENAVLHQCTKRSPSRRNQKITLLRVNNGGTDTEDKFSVFQRIESTKTAALGALSGGILSTPFIALHDLPAYGPASWEFDTDMGALQGAMFAIVYRYCVREDDDNDMLNMGVV